MTEPPDRLLVARDLPRTLLLGTASPHKLRELRRMLGDVGVAVRSLGDFSAPPVIEETGRTFAENARLKALGLARWSGLPVAADDSGLEVDALGGAPGVESRRFAGPDATDEDRNRLLLERLAGLPPARRGAQYVCALALAFQDRLLIEVQGVLRGRIASAPAGTAGFGYDPLFIPEGYDRTIGLLGEEIKDRVSHRARALTAFKRQLLALYAAGGSSDTIR
jgi:XTP/dITP diphosphohydrolase